MKYISTRGTIKPIDFCDAVMMGLATDGGLILPESIPDCKDRLAEFSCLSYQELCFEIMKLYISDIPDDELKALVDKSYATFDHPDIAPLLKTSSCYILEMFHGPTLAFKDLALQFLGNLFEHILQGSDKQLNILAATSGDTGSAAIHGVRGKDKIKIFVLHPYKKVSPLQEKQMTTVLDDNVFNIAINGTFDDAQRIIKETFADIDFKTKHHLGAVNSVNWARVLAQIVYYFYASLAVCKEENADAVNITVPTGNFGNIFAGYLACQMGAPINKLVLATNENDILSRFMQSGTYALADVQPSLSPSMDIQVASNFERYLYYQCNQDSEKLLALMNEFKETGSITPSGDIDSIFAAGAANAADTKAIIKTVYEDDGYILDPHTAVGVHVAQQHQTEVPMICMATADPAKFPDAVNSAIGIEARHPILDALKDLPSRCETLDAENQIIQSYLTSNL
ncbi:MAG: threonine synthase [Lentisphaeria bacterium]|nr:threonine synthase [Lentisphaeria bacterium]